ncbi:type II toxin-antitoxin system HicB family antitoxin [Mycetocola miduiensis]|uniref:Predicted nuclease of the RNAse H fold, HicB family n=1 Tax=Mycetocola miduiensis TaxID=995034 RepID=A0A1I5C642_9MICO|nr:toxin-antitoxin system HicB family antitoxin [Mycetocola miduiensis]SFN82489.1 Predicted nuclease of the RNAse H fold, HicB family [Mycetocola miduiensis]
MSDTIERPAVEHYRYSVEWSAEDGEFVATVAEFPSLSWLASTQINALRGLETVVTSVIDDLSESGETIPEPLADRTYSGRVNLRVSAATHRKLAAEALRRGKSLNSYATELLER